MVEQTYDQMAQRVAELNRRLETNPLDSRANAELERLLDKMHPSLVLVGTYLDTKGI